MTAIGVSLTSGFSEADEYNAAALMIERARVAGAAGLDYLTVGDHHARSTPYVQNTPILGRLLAEWDDRPAGCLFLVPLWHPVLMAEHIGTLATLAEGSFIVQTGLGYGEQQFAAMTADLRRRPSVLEESVRVVKALIAGETVESEQLGIAEAVVRPRPPRDVEWWIGGGAPVAIERAARIGDAWYCGPGPTIAELPAMLETYLDACSANGTEPKRIALRRDVLVTDDPAEARRIGDDLVAAGYRGMTSESLVYGGVDDAVDRFGRLAELGFTDIVVRQMAVPQPLALRSYELLAEVKGQLAG